MKTDIIIDVYSDTICPWCYIGLKKIKSSFENFSNIKFSFIWRPFQLNPDMPLVGMNRHQYLEMKFNGKENAKKIYKSIHKEGLKNNINFQFDKILITPNSFASHKLLALAHKLNKQTEVVESLFYEYFIKGMNIGNLDVLTEIAKQHKIHDDFTEDYINSSKDNKNLLSEEKYARQLGIKGVPCFIINKEFILFGAQDKENFINIFKKLMK